MFLVDSAASHHIVPDENLLFNFTNHDEPVLVKTADENAVLYSVGEDYLPVKIMFGNLKTILVLKIVQCIRKVSNLIISVATFHSQFGTSLMLNVRSGYIYSRKLKQKIASVQMN